MEWAYPVGSVVRFFEFSGDRLMYEYCVVEEIRFSNSKKNWMVVCADSNQDNAHHVDLTDKDSLSLFRTMKS